MSVELVASIQTNETSKGETNVFETIQGIDAAGGRGAGRLPGTSNPLRLTRKPQSSTSSNAG